MVRLSAWGHRDRDAVLATLRAREAELRAAGVRALYLFGSTVAGTANAASDVDLFMDQADPDVFDLLDLIGVSERIGEALGGVPVDLATRASLHPVLRPAIDVTWREIAGIGNVLRHEYQRVEDRLVWNVIRDHLGPLDTAARAALADLPEAE